MYRTPVHSPVCTATHAAIWAAIWATIWATTHAVTRATKRAAPRAAIGVCLAGLLVACKPTVVEVPVQTAAAPSTLSDANPADSTQAIGAGLDVPATAPSRPQAPTPPKPGASNPAVSEPAAPAPGTPIPAVSKPVAPGTPTPAGSKPATPAPGTPTPAGSGPSAAVQGTTSAAKPGQDMTYPATGNPDASTPGTATSPTASPSGSDTTGAQDELADPAAGDTTPGQTPAPGPATQATAGQASDCATALPCTWSSEDEGFTLSVTAIDNTGFNNRLVLDFEVRTVYDTTLAFGNGAALVDAEGAELRIQSRALAQTNGSQAIEVMAGTPIAGQLEFERRWSGNSLPAWSITLLDNGVARSVQMSDLPVGPGSGTPVDCGGALPCQWQSTDGTVLVNLLSAGGASGNGRINVQFTVTTTAATELALESGSEALASNGTPLTSRTLTLANQLHFALVEASSRPDIPVTGSIAFNRIAPIPEVLNSLAMVLYERAPVPRWNPVFQSIPID